MSIEVTYSQEAKATAVIPVRNGRDTIGMTLGSLFRQEGGLLKRIVIVNDDSRDDTLRAVSESAASFRGGGEPSVEIITNTTRQWHYRSRNIGAGVVDTRYMFFLDADDMVAPQYVLKMISALEENLAAPFAYCDLEHVTVLQFSGGRDEIQVQQEFRLPPFDLSNLIRHNFISYSSMIRTSCFREVGGNSELLNDCWNHAVERHLWLRLVHGFGPPAHVPERLFRYRIHASQQSKRHKRGRSDQQTQMFFNLGFVKVRLSTQERKILLVCRGRDMRDPLLPSVEMYTWIRPLQEFGEVFCFFPDVEEKFFGRKAMLERLVQYAGSIGSEHVFCAGCPAVIDGATWDALSAKSRITQWVPGIGHLPKNPAHDFRSFSHVLTPDPRVEKGLKSIAPRVCLTPWAANLHYLTPAPQGRRDIDVVFPGERTPYRSSMVEGLPVLTCGPQWSDGMLEYPALCRTMARSKIVLNLSREGEPLQTPNLRIFEAASCGALCLTEPVRDLDRFFKVSSPASEIPDPSDEAVVFEGRQGLKSRLEMLLQNPALLERIASNGLSRTHNDHRWSGRLQPVFGFPSREGQGLPRSPAPSHGAMQAAAECPAGRPYTASSGIRTI